MIYHTVILKCYVLLGFTIKNSLSDFHWIDNYENPINIMDDMYEQREYEDKHIFSTSTKHYPMTWIQLFRQYTLTYLPYPSTMKISFPTERDSELDNATFYEENSKQMFKNYLMMQRKFIDPDEMITHTTIDADYKETEDYQEMRKGIERYLELRNPTTIITTPAPKTLITEDIIETTINKEKKKKEKLKKKKKKTDKDNEDYNLDDNEEGEEGEDDDDEEDEADEGDEEEDDDDGEEEENEEYNEIKKFEHLSKMDTEEILAEEKRIKDAEEREKFKKNINIVVRDYDETNKTGLKYKHKEYVKKGFYFKDESAQFVKGSKEYLPKIKTNHSNLNKFIERIHQHHQPGVKGIKTGYKYRKERFKDSGLDFRDEAGKFYRKNLLIPNDTKDYDIGFRFQDTITNNSFGKKLSVLKRREGVQFRKGFGEDDYNHKYKHEYENYEDSQYKVKNEAHQIQKNLGQNERDERIHYEVKNEQHNHPHNLSQFNIDHFDYDKVEAGNRIQKRKPRKKYARKRINNRFDYINEDIEERDDNKTFALKQKSGKIKYLNNGSYIWTNQNISKPNNRKYQQRNNNYNNSLSLDNKMLDVINNRNDVHYFDVNETGFHIKDEMFIDPYLDYKHNKSAGRLYSKLAGNNSYKDIVFNNIETRYKNKQDGYRKNDKRGHIIIKDNIQNVSHENKKEYNLIHEKLIKPDFKMINEKGFIRDNIRDYDYYDKVFTHYIKEFKNKNIKYTQQYNQIVNVEKQVINDSKLNVKYYKLMQKSHDRVLYKQKNDTWKVPWEWQDNGLFYAMPPAMNFVPFLGRISEEDRMKLETENTQETPKPPPSTTTQRRFRNYTQRTRHEDSGDTYEESLIPDDVDPQFLDSNGMWIYPDENETTTMQMIRSEELMNTFFPINGTREQREFNYIDIGTGSYTWEPTTTHKCTIRYDMEKRRVVFCEHHTHQVVCQQCNKTFKGWYEYNLHDQAINRKFNKYFFDPDGYFKDTYSVKFVNGTVRPGIDMVISNIKATIYGFGNVLDRKITHSTNFPMEEFNNVHHFNNDLLSPRPGMQEFYDLWKDEPNSALLYQTSEEEIKKPDFKGIYAHHFGTEKSTKGLDYLGNYTDYGTHEITPYSYGSSLIEFDELNHL